MATLTLSYIASDEQKKLLEAESRVCPFISSNDITGIVCRFQEFHSTSRDCYWLILGHMALNLE